MMENLNLKDRLDSADQLSLDFLILTGIRRV